MEKEFVLYDRAVKLKQLGFDYPCLFAWCNKGGWNKYTGKEEPIIQVLRTDGNPFGDFFEGKNWNIEVVHNTKNSIQCSAPTFQQAFRWFREKYHIIGEPKYKGGLTTKTSWYDYIIYSNIDWKEDNKQYKTYEEAELACLDKLIEIVESKNK